MATAMTVPSFRSHFPSLSLRPNMNSATLKSPPCPKPSRWVRFRSEKEPRKQLKCFHISAPESSRLRLLVSEFKALPEPIDRVKRLLSYAAALPRLEESGRVEVNRVPGCAAQVWVEARMDSNGLMRFRADSDSEISKGFCSCLIWLLDGAPPEEVAALAAEDLAEVNVGQSGTTPSRVNTWQNVLVSMQKKTRLLVDQRRTAVAIDEITSEGIHGRTQPRSGSVVLTREKGPTLMLGKKTGRRSFCITIKGNGQLVLPSWSAFRAESSSDDSGFRISF